MFLNKKKTLLAYTECLYINEHLLYTHACNTIHNFFLSSNKSTFLRKISDLDTAMVNKYVCLILTIEYKFSKFFINTHKHPPHIHNTIKQIDHIFQISFNNI